MKSLKVINTVVALALTSVVSAQSTCSSKITDKGYECCSSNCEIVYTDDDGDWGYENGHWCGCGNNNTDVNTNNNCSPLIISKGYSCCPSNCTVVYTDEDGTWGIDENDNWCGCNPETEDNKPIKGKTDLEQQIKEYENRINEVLEDDKEIEKKWLIDVEKIPYDFSGLVGIVYNIKQTYICFDPEIRFREYTDDDGEFIDHEMTIKTNLTEDGLIRDEVNIHINQEQYNNMVKKQEGNTIFKTRYQFLYDGEIIAIDIFHGDLAGLAYMEIEFATKEESDAFATPDWVIKDVTDDIRYKNGHLARYGIPNPQ